MGVHFLTQYSNPLAYPAGYAPGYNPSHIAAGGTRFSGISVPGNFLNILSGKVGTLSGTPTWAVKSYVGPVTYFTSSSASFTGQSTANDEACTIGTIVYPINQNNSCVFSSSGDNAGWRTIHGGFGAINYQLVAGGVAVTINTGDLVPGEYSPWFLATSAGLSTSCYVVKNLANGKTRFAESTGPGSTLASNGTYMVGANTFGQNYYGGIAAVMFSGRYNSLQSLLQWAADPWSFWYPNPGDNWIAAQAAGFPWWAVKNNHMILGAN